MQSVQQPQQHAESARGGLSKIGECKQKGRDKRSEEGPCESIKPFKVAGQSHLTVNMHKLKIGVWYSLQIHFQEQLGDGGCNKTATQKQSATTPLLPYLTQGGCKTVSSPIIRFIIHQAEQAKQFTWETVPRDFTSISFQPGTYQSLTHLPVGLQTCTQRIQLQPPRD